MCSLEISLTQIVQMIDITATEKREILHGTPKRNIINNFFLLLLSMEIKC